MRISWTSRTPLAVTGRSLTLLAFVLSAAPICSAANITYNVNLTIGAGSATGDIVTDGTIGFLTKDDIVDWNLLLNTGTTSFDVTRSNGEVAGITDSALSATATQLLFDFDVVSISSSIFFASLTFPQPEYELCIAASANTCVSGSPAGAEQINYFTFSGVGDTSDFAVLSGTQVIGTATGSGSGTPEPSTVVLFGAGFTLLGFRKLGNGHPRGR